jgi:hypothetical protein
MKQSSENIVTRSSKTTKNGGLEITSERPSQATFLQEEKHLF